MAFKPTPAPALKRPNPESLPESAHQAIAAQHQPAVPPEPTSDNPEPNRVNDRPEPEGAGSLRDTAAKRVSETIQQAKEQLATAYDRVSHNVNDSYDKAVEYAHHNPGKTSLILFGAGVGIGAMSDTLHSTRESLTSAYDRVSHNVNESREKAMEYAHNNPGKTNLLMFGAGVGVGVLLATQLKGSRIDRSIASAVDRIKNYAIGLFQK